jgi:hypothetical protein
MYLCDIIYRVSGNSTCTSVILGENKDLTEEESSGDMSSSRSQGEETPPSKELRKSQVKVNLKYGFLEEPASTKPLIYYTSFLGGWILFR